MDMKALHKKLNDQMNFELYSGYIYMQMAAYTESEEYAGFTHWLTKQAHEEYEHAMRFWQFLSDMGERPEWDAIPKPETNYKSLLDVFEKALDHEKEVTARIHELFDDALKADCKRTRSFLKWFVDEQLEEEVSFGEVVTKLERVGDKPMGLYMLDSQMAKR